MIILFTGHRDKILSIDKLDEIANLYPDATWMHGGAIGFDNQVALYAKSHNINQIVIRPDYQNNEPKIAPLIRNKTMVEQSDLVIACYDGRNIGGTKYTIDYARKRGKQIYIYIPL